MWLLSADVRQMLYGLPSVSDLFSICGLYWSASGRWGGQECPVIYRNFSGIIFEQNIYDNSWSIPDNSWPQHSPPSGQQWLFMNANFRKFSVNWNKKFTSISGQFMAIHVDPNKSARRTTSRLCFSQECPVIYRNFSIINCKLLPFPFAMSQISRIFADEITH